jgi:hypothetical protein
MVCVGEGKAGLAIRQQGNIIIMMISLNSSNVAWDNSDRYMSSLWVPPPGGGGDVLAAARLAPCRPAADSQQPGGQEKAACHFTRVLKTKAQSRHSSWWPTSSTAGG